ncbi:hypothetical protein Tph_c12110 [Thermacetogenium phaeum DSM 12270]|jgi:hypothetical protein|uniref:Uncharacterized protein n=1 Tax=Thermacetogenium phaeum (strain ATCC BAA-254 / DSM 26808 / PB) TaxID=1089553 RepID=K4LH86_THEPS|nr:hypothetical protein Tph_c12110 [Thermacetogenium phaeum DSM 12270]
MRNASFFASGNGGVPGVKAEPGTNHQQPPLCPSAGKSGSGRAEVTVRYGGSPPAGACLDHGRGSPRTMREEEAGWRVPSERGRSGRPDGGSRHTAFHSLN